MTEEQKPTVNVQIFETDGKFYLEPLTSDVASQLSALAADTGSNFVTITKSEPAEGRAGQSQAA